MADKLRASAQATWEWLQEEYGPNLEDIPGVFWWLKVLAEPASDDSGDA